MQKRPPIVGITASSYDFLLCFHVTTRNKNAVQPKEYELPFYSFFHRETVLKTEVLKEYFTDCSSGPVKFPYPFSYENKVLPLHRGFKYFSSYLHSSPGRPWLKSHVNSPISWLFTDMSSWHTAI